METSHSGPGLKPRGDLNQIYVRSVSEIPPWALRQTASTFVLPIFSFTLFRDSGDGSARAFFQYAFSCERLLGPEVRKPNVIQVFLPKPVPTSSVHSDAAAIHSILCNRWKELLRRAIGLKVRF